MKTDLYTKVILTIIAVALTIIVIRDISFATPANANNSNMNNSVPAVNNVIDVNLKSIGGQDFEQRSYDNSFKGPYIPVEVKESCTLYTRRLSY